MWIFLPSGLLMPSAFPADKVPAEYLQPGYDIQVRARTKDHLTNFLDTYMAPGTFSEIQATPEMDYNFRFYCSHDDFAWAMGKAIADIDYKKFKPTAEETNADGTPRWGKGAAEYHTVLNAIWGTVTKLGAPGGWWGEYDKRTNPNGYKPKEYSTRYGKREDSYAISRGTSVQKALSAAPGWNHLDDDFGDEGWLDNDQWIGSETTGYSYSDDGDEAQAIIRDLQGSGIPVKEWLDSCSEREYALIKAYIPAERRAEKSRERLARRQAKRSHGKAA